MTKKIKGLPISLTAASDGGIPRTVGWSKSTRAVIANYDLVANDPSGHMEGLRHLTFTYDSCVHELLAQKIHFAFSGAACVR